MPLFEFVCAECNRPFEELVRSANAVSEVACPRCGSSHVNKKISTFAARVSGGSFYLSAGPAAACNTGT